MNKNKLSKRINKNRTFPLISELIFRKWLYENIDRLHHKPVPNGKGGFYFKGITRAINLIIDYRLPEVILSFDDISTDENYDYHTIEYIGCEKYDPVKGFYDKDRRNKIFTYFKTYSELIITEVFEPIIEYCNENFQENKSLYLIDYNGSNEGFIASSDETNIVKLNKLKLKNNKDTHYLKYNLLTQT